MPTGPYEDFPNCVALKQRLLTMVNSRTACLGVRVLQYQSIAVSEYCSIRASPAWPRR